MKDVRSVFGGVVVLSAVTLLNELFRTSRASVGPALSIATLLWVLPIGSPALAARPTTPDGCVTPNVVTEATFPAFVFANTIEVSPNVFATGTFLADATGKCTRLIGTWPGAEVDFRYNADANRALVLTTRGNEIVVGLSSVSFGASGPVVMPLSGPTPILDTTEIPLPLELPTDWKFGAPEFNRVSPDGSQLLMKLGFSTSSGEGTGLGPSIVTCSLSYEANSTIKAIDPLTCREVHRYTQHANWHEIVAWGVLPGTIYTTHPSSLDPTKNSLYRVTAQYGAPSVVEELFYNGGILMGARANPASPLATVNGEIVAVYQLVPNGDTRCSQAIVIDAYNCDDLHHCRIVHQKGMRSVTWLPDGRLAGSGQTVPKKGNGTCLENGTFVAYPAMDSNNTAPTVLTTTSLHCSAPWGTCMEGSSGGW